MTEDLKETCESFKIKIEEGERLLDTLTRLRKQCNIDIEKYKRAMNNEIDGYINAIERFNSKHEADLLVIKRAITILDETEWRDEVLIRDKFKCQKCGSMHEPTCHHIIPKKFQSNFTYNPNNGIVLCKECHEDWHKTHDNETSINTFIKWLEDKE